jgi:hypothetical protein
MLASIAGLFLLQADGKYSLSRSGRWGLAVLFVATLNPRALAEHWHVPIGPFITAALFALVASVALRAWEPPSWSRHLGLGGDPVDDPRFSRIDRHAVTEKAS